MSWILEHRGKKMQSNKLPERKKIKQIPCQRLWIWMALNFSTTMPEDRKKWSDAFKTLKKNDFQPRILYSEKLPNTKVKSCFFFFQIHKVANVLSPCAHSQEAACMCPPPYEWDTGKEVSNTGEEKERPKMSEHIPSRSEQVRWLQERFFKEGENGRRVEASAVWRQHLTTDRVWGWNSDKFRGN